MKAAQLVKYSKKFKVNVVDIDIPTPQANEVLVKVRAAAVNPVELLIATGSVRLIQNYATPLIIGNEISGDIVEIGNKVKKFKVGDKVYSRLPLDKIGGLAEYVVIRESALALAPSNLDYRQSAAVALGGLTAFQAFTENLNVKPGDTVLITGASGSFGQIAIPIARSLGLNVIATGNSEGRENALKNGATRYFDYTKENYWEHIRQVDYVIDTVGIKDLDNELSVIKEGGKLLSLIMGPNKRFAEFMGFTGIKRFLFSQVGRKIDKKVSEKDVEYHFIFVHEDGEQLRYIAEVIENNMIIPSIHNQIFTIEEVEDALNRVSKGKTTGKVIVEFE